MSGDNWQDDPALKRAAFIGMIGNGALPSADRIAMAQQVIRELETELETAQQTAAAKEADARHSHNEALAAIDLRQHESAAADRLRKERDEARAEAAAAKQEIGRLNMAAHGMLPLDAPLTTSVAGFANQLAIYRATAVRNMVHGTPEDDEREEKERSTVVAAYAALDKQLNETRFALQQWQHGQRVNEVSMSAQIKALKDEREANEAVIKAATAAAADIRGLRVKLSAPAQALLAAVDARNALSAAPKLAEKGLIFTGSGHEVELLKAASYARAKALGDAAALVRGE